MSEGFVAAADGYDDGADDGAVVVVVVVSDDGAVALVVVVLAVLLFGSSGIRGGVYLVIGSNTLPGCNTSS